MKGKLPAGSGGVVVVDKPSGMTSHDVVSRVRRKLGTREVGHAGTLDPMATGVLVVAVGEATKLVPWLTADDKEYEATLRLGVETASGDADGAITREIELDSSLLAELSQRGAAAPSLAFALDVERARSMQVPPAVSAIKVDGVASHVRVRRGEDVQLPARPVAVRRLDVGQVDVSEGRVLLSVSIRVAKGYYVRALARDLAASLGTVAHLTALARIRSGDFSIGEAVALDALTTDAIVPLARAASRVMPSAVLVDEAAVLRARRGQPMSPTCFSAELSQGPSAWLDTNGTLVAIGTRDAESIRVVRGMVTIVTGS